MSENSSPVTKKRKLETEPPKTEPTPRNNDFKFTKKGFPMHLAETASSRSEFEIKVGACIVDAEYRILGYGYNGYPCLKDKDNKKYLDFKNSSVGYLFKCCAAQNAIHFSTGSVRGASLYVTSFPCEHCAKAIVQAGIAKVIYLNKIKYLPQQHNGVSEYILNDYLGDNLIKFDQLPFRKILHLSTL